MNDEATKRKALEVIFSEHHGAAPPCTRCAHSVDRLSAAGLLKTDAEARLVEGMLSHDHNVCHECNRLADAVRAERALAAEKARPKPRYLPEVGPHGRWGVRLEADGVTGLVVECRFTESQSRAMTGALNALEAGGGK